MKISRNVNVRHKRLMIFVSLSCVCVVNDVRCTVVIVEIIVSQILVETPYNANAWVFFVFIEHYISRGMVLSCIVNMYGDDELTHLLLDKSISQI